MSWCDQVRAAFEYNEWANDRLLDAAGKLSDEQLASERGGSRGSVADNLVHLVDTQGGWAAFIGETDFTPPQPLPEQDIMAALCQRFAESHARLREITGGLTDESLATVVRRERRG